MEVIVHQNVLQKIFTFALKACSKIGLCCSDSVFQIPVQHHIWKSQKLVGKKRSLKAAFSVGDLKKGVSHNE